MLRCFLSILLTSLLPFVGRCNDDVYYSKTFGNVHVTIAEYDEVVSEAQLEIIGELASRLCESYGYKDRVFIDLNYICTRNCSGNYFLSLEYNAPVYGRSGRIKSRSNLLRLETHEVPFNPVDILNVLEYGLSNSEFLERNKQLVEYKVRFQEFEIKSIDTSVLSKIAQSASSANVKAVLATKVQIDKPLLDTNSIYFYFLGNKFHFYTNESCSSDSAVLSIDSIWQFKRISASEALVFDTDSSFYYITSLREKQVSSRHIVCPIASWGFRPILDIERRGRGLLLIKYRAISSPLGEAHYTLGYSPDADSVTELRSWRAHN